MIQTLIVFPAPAVDSTDVLEPALLEPELDEDEQAEATSATDAVAQASAASFLRFTTFLRWTVSGRTVAPDPTTLSWAGPRSGAHTT
jgi:hypothetical protein